MTQVSYCPRNPKNETNLRCSRCDELICPDCMVQTPVGARCPTCARATRIPTYTVTPAYMARGIAAGVVSALALGVAFIFVNNLLLLVPVLFPYLHVAVVAGVGYVVGEVRTDEFTFVTNPEIAPPQNFLSLRSNLTSCPVMLSMSRR